MADVGFPSDPDGALHHRREVRLARLLEAAAHEVGALLGRDEAPFAEQVDVGLGAGGLVLGVREEPNLGGHGCRCRAADEIKSDLEDE